ncbi:sensor histidine kinase [Hymenobacter sp. BT664]|uniref:Sensor histidine kinase n=1 Tax=Hymenobacter montanus TaxID=2771359 RepID=A0A927BEQ5_9BACT|nr:sensor histidine kinase [Hymenobacter montanus]MBD2769506.1 sensor histidine kinase [Hymenobacter montanus]
MKRHPKTYLLVALGLLVFCLLLVLLIRLLVAGSFEQFHYYWNAVACMFFYGLLSIGVVRAADRRVGWVNSVGGGWRYARLFGVSAGLYVAVAVASSIGFEWWVMAKPPTRFGTLVFILVYFIIHAVLGNCYIAYRYLAELLKTRELFLLAQQAQTEMQLRQLQQQTNPHFLFNSLNILSALIGKSPALAQRFLTNLTELYRYSLQHQDEEVVALAEEVAFAQNYVYLLEQRFSGAYRFNWQLAPAAVAAGGFVVPTTLQGLLENVVKHNEGSCKVPLEVSIALDEGWLVVHNVVRAKPAVGGSLGTGLRNLRQRYALLTDEPVDIRPEPDSFTVRVPLLKLLAA